MRRTFFLVPVTALCLLAQACGLFGDDTSPTTLPPATEAAIVATTTGDISTTAPTTTAPCLAVPLDSGNRDRVGRIGEFFGQRGEADCEEIFGGEDLDERAVLATDDTGSFTFTLDKVIDRCQVQLSSELVIHPADHVVLEIRDGEVICSFEGADGGGDQSLSEGYSIIVNGHEVIPIGPMVALQMITGDGATSIIVTEGLIRIEPEGLTCRSLIGEGQSALVAPDVFDLSAFTVDQLDAAAFDHIGAVYTPALPGAELLPGISELIAANQVTVLVDGDLFNPQDLTQLELFPTLEVITGSELQLEGIGRIGVIGDLSLQAAPDLEFVPQPLVIDDLFLQPLPLLSAGDLTQALDTPVVEPQSWDFLIDPAGQRWTLAFDATNEDLSDSLTDMLTAEVISGAYGAYYRDAFDIEPVLDLALPHLLEGSVSCLEAP